VAPATRFEGFVERLAAFFDLPAARMRELAGAIADPAAPSWSDDVVAGVRLLHFAGGERRAAAHCGIVHVAAGVRYPRHRHEGTEWTFVLAGVAEDEDDGRRLEPGDLEAQPAGSAHAYRSAGDEPLVFAVVLEGDIRFV
jgi:anti-sigma factor ChrR (cupin superfamily)